MMKKMIWISIIWLTLSGFVFAENFDIKNARWGMTKEEVIKTEPNAPVENNSKSVVYADSLDNKQCYVVYFFQNNQLYCTCYDLMVNHPDQNDYITDFSDIRQFLTQKYGKPISDDALKTNGFTSDDLQNCGLAVSVGHLQYRTIWETDRSKIALWLFGKDSKIKLTIVYESKTTGKESESKDKPSSKEKGDYKTFCLGDSTDVCKQKYDNLKKNKELPGGLRSLFDSYRSFSTTVSNIPMTCNLYFNNGQLYKIYLKTYDSYNREQLNTVLESIVVDKFGPIFVSLYGEPTSNYGYPPASSLTNGYTTFAYRWNLEKKRISIGVSKSEEKQQNGNKTIITIKYEGVIIIEDKRFLDEEKAKNDKVIEDASKDF